MGVGLALAARGGGESGGTAAAPADPAKASGDITVLTNRTDLVQDGTFRTYVAEFKETYPGPQNGPAFLPVRCRRPWLRRAWRELAANMTTNGVLAQQAEAFPLMYHWRALPGAPPLADEHTDIDRVVAYRGGSSAVRRRLDALAETSASVVLFLQYIPQDLSDLAGQTARGRLGRRHRRLPRRQDTIGGTAVCLVGSLL